MENIVFVYHKDGIIKVLGAVESRISHDNLIKDGWTHTATLNACVWIEYLFNKAGEDIESEVRGLNKVC